MFMKTDFIKPITPELGVGATANQNKETENNGVFGQVLNSAIESLVATENAVYSDSTAITTGDIDDLHQLTISSTEANLTLSFLLQLRNRALDSYNEIMRITL